MTILPVATRISYSPTSLLSLPPELLTEISAYLPDRHPTLGYATDCGDIAAFSSASRVLHAIARPILFRSVPITSKLRLYHLSAVHPGIIDPLDLIKELNIVMDVDFLEAFESFAMSLYAPETASYDAHCPFSCLIAILSRTSHIHTLRIHIPHELGTHSSWQHFSLTQVAGIPVGRALADGLQHVDEFDLPSLRVLELDGFQDVECFLKLSPRLQRLTLRMSAGFGLGVNEQLVEALRYVPELKELSYDPVTLGLPRNVTGYEGEVEELESEEEQDEEIHSNVGSGDSSCDMLVALGQALPNLEVLELQSRWFGSVVLFCSSSEPLLADALIKATAYLPNLKHLSLPSSVFCSNDFALLRSPYPMSPNPTASPYLEQKLLSERGRALQRVQSAELTTITEIAQHAPGIRSVCFVRHARTHDRLEYGVTYLIRSSATSPGCTEHRSRRNRSVRIEEIRLAYPDDVNFHCRRIKKAVGTSMTVLPALPPTVPSPDIRSTTMNPVPDGPGVSPEPKGIGRCLTTGPDLYLWPGGSPSTCAR